MYSPHRNKTTWVPTKSPPMMHEPTSIKLVSRTTPTAGVVHMEFKASGPDHMSLFISPKEGINVTAISLLEETPEADLKWKGRDVFYIKYGYGKEAALEFTVEVKTPENWNKPTLDLLISGHYVHVRLNEKSDEFKRVLSELPDWTDVMPALSSYEAWIF